MTTISRSAISILAATLSSGCFGLSEQEEARLNSFKFESKKAYETQEFLRAEDYCKKGLLIDPDDVSLHQVLGYSILRQERGERIAESVAAFEAGIDAGDDFDFKSYLGLGEARFQEALYHRNRMKRIETDERLSLEERAQLIPDERAAMEESFRLAEEALLEVLDTPRGKDDTIAHNTLARLYSVSGRYAEAADVLRPLTATLARSIRVRSDQVNVESLPVDQRREYEASIAYLRDQQIEAMKLLAAVAAKLDRWEEVVSVYNQIDSLESMQPADFFNRAEAYEALGAREAAASDYETFIKQAARRGATYTQIADKLAAAMERVTALRGAAEPASPGS